MSGGFTFTPATDATEVTIEEAVFQAVGAASACWERLDGAGVFDTTRAKQIGDALLEKIRVSIDETLARFREELEQPRLGLATTRELIRELDARADVADVIGESWPSYRTVGEAPA